MIQKIQDEWRYIDPVTGEFYPWYTLPCIEWLLTLNLKNKRIFEYGVGDSTIWYRKQGAYVYGVDDNFEWANKMGVYFSDWSETYTNHIMLMGIPFDIVVIDGAFRDECTLKALSMLRSGGCLIIDNYKQPSVQAEWPLTEKLIEGMPIKIYKEPGHYDWVTAVITKP